MENKRAKHNEKLLIQKKKSNLFEDTINSIIKKVRIGIALIQAEYKDESVCYFSFTKINDTFKKITGLNAKDLVKKNFFIVFPEFDKKVLDDLIKVLKTKKSFKLEMFIKSINKFCEIIISYYKEDFLIIQMIDVSDKINYQTIINKTEYKYNKLFSSIKNSVFIHEVSLNGDIGKFIEVNDDACKMLGYSRKELLNMSPFDIDSKISKVNTGELSKKLAEGRSVIFEQLHVAKDGRQIPVEINANPIIIDGKPAVISIVRDLRDRKQFEDKLMEIEYFSKTLIENLPDIIIRFDKDYRHSYVSPNIEKYFKFDHKNFIDKTHRELKFDDNICSFWENSISNIFYNAIQTVKYFTFNTKMGEVIFEIRFIPEFDNSKRVIFVLCILRDVTEQIRVEKEILAKNFAIESASTGIGIADINGYVTYINRAMVDLLKYKKKEEIIGRHITELVQDPTVVNKIIKDVLEFGAKTLERKMKVKDGSLIDLNISVNQIKNKNNELIGFIASFLDISSSKKVEQELIKAKEKAEESEKLKSAFLANMSHEIRTPMNGIIGFSDLLKEEGITTEERKYFVDIIIKSGHQLLGIVDDILDISKIESGQMNVKKEKVFINNLLYEIFINFQDKAKDKNIGLIVNKGLNDNEAIVFSDETRLKQILNNLISNSIKFTDKGYIKFGYKVKENNLEFFVKDTGIGIKKENYDQIFKPFHLSDQNTVRQITGTGLGLSICKGIIKLLDGEIWFNSSYKKGTAFYFTLPYVFAKIINEKNDIKKTILIAEDEGVNYLFLEKFLTRKGFKIIHAQNGKDAINLVNIFNTEIKLILMDIKMPIMNGYEATKIIKDGYPGIPVIAITAYAMEEDKEKAAKFGFNDYLSKPVNIQNLLNTIYEHIID